MFKSPILKKYLSPLGPAETTAEVYMKFETDEREVLNKWLRLKIILLGKDDVSILNQINHHTRESFDMASIKQRFLGLKSFHSYQEGNTKMYEPEDKT